MKRYAAWCTFLVVGGVASCVVGAPPLIDPPTPPPCAADGRCYPNTGGWGYYQSRWRSWPGTTLEPTPSKSPTPAAGGRISPELNYNETPPQDLEDAAAPPSSPRRDERPLGNRPLGEEPAGEAPTGEPPAAEPLQRPAGEVPPPQLGPLGPTSDIDTPPELPSSLSLAPPTNMRREAQSVPARPLRAPAPRVSSSDPPPSPPWAQSASL